MHSDHTRNISQKAFVVNPHGTLLMERQCAVPPKLSFSPGSIWQQRGIPCPLTLP